MRVDWEVVSSSQLVSNERPGSPIVNYSLLGLESVGVSVECLIVVDVGVHIHNHLLSNTVSNVDTVYVGVYLHPVVVVLESMEIQS